MSYQQIREVVSLPPAPPRLTNNNYIYKESCPKRLDQHNENLKSIQTTTAFHSHEYQANQ